MKTDKVTLRIINNALLYASEEMGLALRNSAYSPNIKERMDHSAAVFDSDGRLLAQAEHIPVHLGSLPWGLRRLLEYCRSNGIGLDEGVMVVANDPYITGTHLNDVTVAAPVHHRRTLVAFVVNKAHHSDVGGVVPGSMGMDAKTLAEEGFVMGPTVLWKRQRFVESEVQSFANASRTPIERRGDLKAQVAANNRGIARVKEVVDRHGVGTFESAATMSIEQSQRLTRGRISKLRAGTYTAHEVLEGRDGDLDLHARVTVGESKVAIDYSGTSEQVDFPLNAVFGVTISGAYFVLRCLLGDDIVANHGAFSPIEVKAPSGTLLNPTSPHPVGGGNVETSQRNADLIFKALSPASRRRVPAAAGGSMNNVMIGGTSPKGAFAFYETIGVGLGGSSLKDGIDGIQSNMTNTMNTPIEEIERALPIRMTRYEFRRDSSGPGKYRGGSGLVRGYQALESGITFTVLAERERHKPWGLFGGRPGSGVELVLVRGDAERRLPSKTTLVLEAGDILEVRTSGGGGFGRPRSRGSSSIARDVSNGIISEAVAKANYPQWGPIC